MSSPAAAAAASSSSSSSSLPASSLTRWDHLWADVRRAVDAEATANDGDEYADLFQSHVVRMVPGLTRSERDLLEVDAGLDWVMRAFERSGEFLDLFTHLNFNTSTGEVIDTADLDAESQPALVHMLRRLRITCPTGWAALIKWVEDDASDDDEANSYMIIGDDEGVEERANQFKAILHDTFTRAEIDNAPVLAPAPTPARFEVKRKLEQLTERVASLTAAEAAAELRAILGEVEESLPEDERTLKRARK